MANLSNIPTGVKAAIAVVAAIGTAEAVALGVQSAVTDGYFVADMIKEEIDPTVYQVKKGLFGKPYLVTKSKRPGSYGELKPYSGSKEPCNKKPIRL